MNFGLVVESDRDSAAYPELIQKIRNDVEFILPIACGGVEGVKSRFCGMLKYFEWGAPQPIDKALVIGDADRSNDQATEAELAHIYQQDPFTPHFPVHFHATKTELETWLLADENAINQVSRARGKGKKVSRVSHDLERYPQAKELFLSQLSRADLPADPQVYREVAGATDIGRVAARCPSFQGFIRKVQDC